MWFDSQNIKGVIFDLDGVMFDSMGMWNDLGAHYLLSKGLTPEPDLSEVLFPMTMEEGAEYIRARYNIPKDASAIMKEIEGFIEHFYFYEVPAKGPVDKLLSFFQDWKIPMIAATSCPRAHAEHALKRLGLFDYLKELLTTTEVGSSKHSPEIYCFAAEKLHTKPEETLVFEDSLYALDTAKSVGFLTVGIYDALGEADQEGLKRACDLYLKQIEDFFL